MRAINFADFIDMRGVGMRQRRSCPRLLQETMQPLRVTGNLGRKKFQGNLAIELGVAGQIDFTHAALTQLGTNFITAEFCACCDHR
jgi:hypothetical protein